MAGSVVAQTFTGVTETCSGKQNMYTYADDVTYTSVNWSVTGGGTIVSGSGLSRVIRFSTPGTVTVKLIRNGLTVSQGTKSVNVYVPGTVSGPSTVCAGGQVNLSLSGQFGTSFTWEYSTNGGSTWTTFGSTGSTASHFPSGSTKYRAYVCSLAGGAANISNVHDVTVTQYPTPYTLSGGGSYCSGGTGLGVSLSGSQSGLTYQLRVNGSNVGSPVSGTGAVITWNNQTAAGTYTVVANNGSCQTTMNGTPGISINVLPTVYNAYGGGTFCGGNNGVYLTSSQSGVSYQLKLSGNNYLTPVTGTGGQLFLPVSQSGSYTVIGSNVSTGCAQNMSGTVSITINTIPSLFTVSGGGTYCTGSSGVSVMLSGSQAGVNYQLKRDGSNSGSALAGTGAGLIWSGLTAGSYTVTATNPSTGCNSAMNGSAVATAYSPAIITLGGGGSFCLGSGSVNITLSGSQSGVSYQLLRSSNTEGSPKNGTGAALTWTVATGGTYTVQATHSSLGCTATMSGSAIATADSPTVGGAVSPLVIDGFGAVSGGLSLTGHAGSVQRWEYDNGGGWLTVSPSNTTSGLTFSNVSANTSYRAIVKNGTCNETTTGIGTVKVHAPPVVAYDQEFIPYGGSVQLSTGAFDSYQWYRNGVAIAGATSQNTTISSPGQYKVEVTKGAASVQSAPVTIKSILATEGNNFRSTTVVFQEGVSTVEDIYELPRDSYAQSVEYQDGIGRPFQVIAIGQSPEEHDIVQPVGYSERGLVETSYLPYVSQQRDGLLRANAIRVLNEDYTSSEQYQFYQNASKVAHDQSPFSVKILSPSPTPLLKEQGAVGSAWQPGTGHTMTNGFFVNGAGTVRQWKADGTSDAYYPAASLTVAQVADEDGNITRTFTDKIERVVLQQQQVDKTIQGVYTSWQETYYVYDMYGRVSMIIPPKAVHVMGNSSTLDANSGSIAELVYRYTYDELGRVVVKKVPGAAEEYFVYDQLDRVVLAQNGNLRAQDRWSFVKYDRFNRPVYQGILASASTRASLQSMFDAQNYSSDHYFEIEEANTTYQGYSNRVYPTTGLTVLSVNYYDHYDFDRNASPDFVYENAALPGQTGQASSNTRLLPTGSRRAVIDEDDNVTGEWLVNAVFYDGYDRAVQVQGNNHLYITVADKSTMIYSNGRVVKSKTTHARSASELVEVTDRYEYDHAGRVEKIFRAINSNPEVEVSAYEYNALGQLVDTKLHNTGSGYLQSVDYRYNIRGWLKSINNSELEASNSELEEMVNNDEDNDYFGMELLYQDAETGLNDGSGDSHYFNGNISAIKWKSTGSDAGASGRHSYKFRYDKSRKLEKATFQAHGSGGWNEGLNTFNEEIGYDHNGNITTLQRNRNERDVDDITVTNNVLAIDNLVYTYGQNDNKLTKVEDLTGKEEGFNNGKSETTEYVYDASGSVTSDQNKGITSIMYNMLGKPRMVLFEDGRRVEYAYDAAGNKISVINWEGTTQLSKTDYSGGFVYENDALSFFSSPEGRVVKKGNDFEYQYAIADHQGNTRIVFSSAPAVTSSITATHEGDAGDDIDEFENVEVNHIWPFLSANHTPGGMNVVRMNQSYPVGPSKSMNVYPGDKVDIEVWEYHEGTGYGGYAAPLNTLVAMVAGIFGGVSGAPGDPGLIYNGIDNAFGAFAPAEITDDERPAAYLNYILFDHEYKVLDMGWKRAPETAYTKHQLSFPTLEIKHAGYLFVYLSYDDESNNWVFFDDLKVSYTPTNIIQSNEYYPFGLQTANSWTREGSSNGFLYNGGSELNDVTKFYDTPFRGYDASLGRFMQIDPLAVMSHGESPYGYASNNPVLFNDPTGLLTWGQFGNIVDNLMRYDNGGTWDRSHGYQRFTSEKAAVSWHDAYRESLNTEGSIVPQYGIVNFNYQGATAVVNTGIVGYTFEPKNSYFFSSTDGFVRLDGMRYETLPYENMTNVDFYLDGTHYTPNSLRSLYGRDVRNSDERVGRFTGVTTLSSNHISHILGYSQYLFYDKYKSLPIEEIARMHSAKGDLDFKNVAYRLLDIGRNELLQINGIAYNANEAGNYLWGMVLDFHGALVSPNLAADLITRLGQGRVDEPWEQRAISAGRAYGTSLRATLGPDFVKSIINFRNSYRLGNRP